MSKKTVRFIVGVVILICIIIGGIYIFNNLNYINRLYEDNNEIAKEINTFNLNNVEQKIEDNNYIGTAEFEGMDTIWNYEATEDIEIELKYILNAMSGKCKIVLISPDNTVNTIFENVNNSQSNDYSTTTLQLKQGINRIKLVADKDTKIQFDFSIENGTFNELGF